MTFTLLENVPDSNLKGIMNLLYDQLPIYTNSDILNIQIHLWRFNDGKKTQIHCQVS